MRVQLRIVAGSHRGRKITFQPHPRLRATPDKVRESLFNILGDAVPDRPFFDVFAGTGINGLEALSRGASQVSFLERDAHLVRNIQQNVEVFDFADRSQILRTDVYRWANQVVLPGEPANVFLSPPFADIQHRTDDLLLILDLLSAKLANGSVLVLQSEKPSPLDGTSKLQDWEQRHYGRNVLIIKVCS